MKSRPAVQPQFHLVPVPAEMTPTGGYAQLPVDLSVYEATPSAVSAAILHELSARKETDADAATVRLLAPETVPRELRRWMANPEGYGIRIGREGIDLWASTSAGHLYGVMTACQLIRQYGRRIPCMRIGDAPVLARRGVQLSFPQGHTAYRRSYLRHLVPQLARWKINELYLYLESFFDFPSLPHMAGPEAMTPSDAKALDRLCRGYNIKVVPMLNTLAHCGEILSTQRYRHLAEYDADKEDERLANPFNFCASSAEVRQLVDGMLNDLCDCFSSDVIHVGGDEVSAIGQCPRCRQDGKAGEALALYLKYFERVLGVLRKRGRKGGLWGDMLLKYSETMSRADLEKRLRPLADRAVIYDWHYTGGSPASLRLFVDLGLPTIACSSTHLCYSSALWPYQHRDQGELFRDAVAAGALGGMTTAWVNWAGLHEEHFNYLHATGGCMLWSGPGREGFVGPLSPEAFETAYVFQRYGMRSKALTDYLHAVGDARGPILAALAPLHGVEVRKCLYHTDNVLLFWKHYAKLLSGGGLENYRTGIRQARRLWALAMKQKPSGKDPFLDLLVGPLLMHEHLIARYEMTEAIYRDYDAAAKVQYQDPVRFRQRLDRVAARLMAHLQDFAPIDAYLSLGRKTVGLDRSTVNRIRATKDKIRELAALIRHLKRSHRPLPAFLQLSNVFLEPSRTRWYGDREHDWAAEVPRFRRYTLNERGPWEAVAAVAEKEGEGHFSRGRA